MGLVEKNSNHLSKSRVKRSSNVKKHTKRYRFQTDAPKTKKTKKTETTFVIQIRKTVVCSTKCEKPKVQSIMSWQVYENTGAGDCLFLALLQFLQNAGIPSPNSACELRKIIIDHVIENWMDKALGLGGYQTEEMEEYECEHYENIELCQELYREYMMDPREYGTAIELGAAVEIYSFDCVVFKYDHIHSITVFNEGPGTYTNKCHLYFTYEEGDEDFDTGHYRFMKPQKDFIPDFPHGEYQLLSKTESSTGKIQVMNIVKM